MPILRRDVGRLFKVARQIGSHRAVSSAGSSTPVAEAEVVAVCRSIHREGWDPQVVRRTGELERAAQAVRSAVEALPSGGLVVVADDHGHEDEGDLIPAGALTTADAVAFRVRHTTGILCAPMPAARARELGSRTWSRRTRTPTAPRPRFTVDHGSCGTGMSAQDRALTLKATGRPVCIGGHLARPRPSEKVRPVRHRHGCAA
ncbi:3,4-dihydroxy-2-butanone-4-phosphate synthase [Pseudonocardia kujensis]|uniref:3,4-dihydroxy-2-butanone-4-phosphate synthase n=1 Tax=Pseudonocardia kujensis TaxID=1128675 RepID=UPI003556C74E